MKPVMTQLMWSTPPRSPTMVGRAVERMVWPRDASSMTTMRLANSSPRWGGFSSTGGLDAARVAVAVMRSP